MQMSSEYTTGLIAAALAALCWGSATVMSKSALGGFYPISLLVIQLIASVSFLWFFILFRYPERLPFREIIKFAWLGLLEPGLAYLLGLTGLADINASGATLIQSSE